MKFAALLKKELRETRLWTISAIIGTAFIGQIIFFNIKSHQDTKILQHIEPGQHIYSYYLRQETALHGLGSLILLISFVLGVILAVQQFGRQRKLRIWPFVIHRSVRRITILLAKFSAAIIAFILSVGLVWTLFFLYATRPGVLPYQPSYSVFIDGWLSILLGAVAYFGIVLTAITPKRQPLTRPLGACFALIIFLLAVIQNSPGYYLAIIAIGLVILICQVIDTFLNREF